MKRSIAFLIILFLLLLSGLLWSNWLLRKEYDKIDIGDKYWSYMKISEKPFRFVRISGGEFTSVAIEIQNQPSVRLMRRWSTYNNSIVYSSISKDTLIISINDEQVDKIEQINLQSETLLRIFTPELHGIFCKNANISILNYPPQSIAIAAEGNSQLGLGLRQAAMDSLHINLQDLSSLRIHQVGRPNLKSRATDSAIEIGQLTGSVNGFSRLQLGNAQIKKPGLLVTDHATVELSGNGLNNLTMIKQSREQATR